MTRKNSRADADAIQRERARIQLEELDRVSAKWNELVSPEDVAKLRSELLANSNPARRKELEELYRDADLPPIQGALTERESIVEGWNQRFDKLVEQHPHAVKLAAKIDADLIARIVMVFGEEARNNAIKVSIGMMPLVFAFADAFAAAQSKIASKPRDRQSVFMAKTIEAMRRARRHMKSLKAFLLDAEAGNVGGLSIRPESDRDPKAYIVELDDTSCCLVRYGRLADWFTKAGKPDSDVPG